MQKRGVKICQHLQASWSNMFISFLRPSLSLHFPVLVSLCCVSWLVLLHYWGLTQQNFSDRELVNHNWPLSYFCVKGGAPKCMIYPSFPNIRVIIPITFILSYVSLRKFAYQVHLSLRIGPTGDIKNMRSRFLFWLFANNEWVHIGQRCLVVACFTGVPLCNHKSPFFFPTAQFCILNSFQTENSSQEEHWDMEAGYNLAVRKKFCSRLPFGKLAKAIE